MIIQDFRVHHGAVKFQEFHGTKNSILRHKIRLSESDKKSSITENTVPVSKVQLEKINLKSRKHCRNKRTKMSDDELRTRYNIKECIVVINRSISKYLIPETMPESNLGNKVEHVLKEYECSSASDREENHTDDNDSSGSDWEEEYKSSKTQKWLRKRISEKTVNSVQNMNLTNHSQQQTNESCSESLECSFIEENTRSLLKKLTSPTTSVTISGSDTYEPSLFTTPHNNRNVPRTKNQLSSQNYATKDLLTSKPTYSGPIEVNSEEHLFPIQISVKTRIENLRSLKFIPLNKTLSNTDFQCNSNDNIQAQPLNITFSNVQPIDAYKNYQDIIEFEQKNKSPPLMPQRSRNDIERLTLENYVLKPKTVVSGPHVGRVDTILLSTSPHCTSPSHGEEKIPTVNCVPSATNKIKSKKTTFQLDLTFESKINNMNLHFSPQNKIASITDTQVESNKNIPLETVNFTKLQPINACKKGGKNLVQVGLKQTDCIMFPVVAQNHEKHVHKTARKILPKPIVARPGSQCIIFPVVAQNHEKHVQKTARKILPKPIVARPGSQPDGVVDMPLCTTPPSQDGCDDGDSDEVSSSKTDQILSQVSYHTYNCNKCNKYFEIVDQYLYHKRHSLCSGNRREAKHQCDICGKCFTGRVKMEAHKNSHTNARPFKCFDCDKCFNSKTARYMHHKIIHLNKKTPRYLCCFCGYITPSPEHLLAHEEEHRLPEGTEAPKPFKCLVCGKGFISRWKQQKHKREHQLKKCGKCSEEFKTDIQLRNHMIGVHSIIKTYDCKECGMQFKHPEILRSHRTTHSSVLLYSCDICDKGFKRKGNLKQHMISHSDERPISCPECGESFKRITHLKQHTAAFHRDGRK